MQAREKRVHKMTRDGLVEQNQSNGKRQRVSKRLSDYSFQGDQGLQKQGQKQSRSKRKQQKNKQQLSEEFLSSEFVVIKQEDRTKSVLAEMMEQSKQQDNKEIQEKVPEKEDRSHRKKKRKKKRTDLKKRNPSAVNTSLQPSTETINKALSNVIIADKVDFSKSGRLHFEENQDKKIHNRKKKIVIEQREEKKEPGPKLLFEKETDAILQKEPKKETKFKKQRKRKYSNVSIRRKENSFISDTKEIEKSKNIEFPKDTEIESSYLDFSKELDSVLDLYSFSPHLDSIPRNQEEQTERKFQPADRRKKDRKRNAVFSNFKDKQENIPCRLKSKERIEGKLIYSDFIENIKVSPYEFRFEKLEDSAGKNLDFKKKTLEIENYFYHFNTEEKGKYSRKKLKTKASFAFSNKLKFRPEEINGPYEASKFDWKKSKEKVPVKNELLKEEKNGAKIKKKLYFVHHRIEKVTEKLPSKQKIKLKRVYDKQEKKEKVRLLFEKEVIPEFAPKKWKAVRQTGEFTKKKIMGEVPDKQEKEEKENTAVEAAYKGTKAINKGLQEFHHYKQKRVCLLYKKLHKLEKKERRLQEKMEYFPCRQENSDSKKRELKKKLQKRKIKQKYAQMAREAEKEIRYTQQATSTMSQVIRFLAQEVIGKKTLFSILVIVLLIFITCSACMTSCSTLLSGIGSAFATTFYLADDTEITESDCYYTDMEADLQMEINHIEETHPGYDEYHYSIGEISHNPYQLMAYLTVKYDAFIFEEMKPVIRRIFEEQYTLELVPEIEIRYDSEGDPYSVSILNVILTVKSLDSIFKAEMSKEEESHYDVLLLSYGNRQAYGNPFSFCWLSHVSSPYGYRVEIITITDEKTGEERKADSKKLHRGIDIAVPKGTPIQAIQDGTVVMAGESDSFGNFIVIEGEKGYQSKYAHCDSLAVRNGQAVKRGEIIGYVGSTGDSTGNHLHLEILHHGEYLNPYFFVDNGGDGKELWPVIPDYSGDAMGDGSFEALIKEAEKYLGFPYVWGGSSPSTSFDCSGFVCWVYTHSGVHNLPRTTAQGIYNQCVPVSREEAKPGDIVFFTNTYPNQNPVTHVGIYVGNGMMIHCGDPIGYANINTPYWQQHFYGFGRLQ